MKAANIKIAIGVVCCMAAAASSVWGATLSRTTTIQRGRDRLIDVYYDGDKEVARHTRDAHGIVDKEGTVLNGRIHFSDEYRKTYGEEYYRKGKKHGMSETFYEDGKIKEKAYYEFGKLIWDKKYYAGGALRFEGYYEDAREEKGNTETGIGKLYNQKGRLRYEWHFTYSDPIGFRKTYNQYGQLLYEEYFDEKGNPLEPEDEETEK